MKTYKAIMHFNKPASGKGTPWTVHYRGTCHIIQQIECNVPMISEWKPSKKSNPRAFFTARAKSLKIQNGIAILD